MFKKIVMLAVVVGLAGCSGSQWQANFYQDEFTNDKACRVEMGSETQREFLRGWNRTYFTYNFYAENYNGQIRAGVRSEPVIPIIGDIQIKVGDKLYTITMADTPLDLKQDMPK